MKPRLEQNIYTNKYILEPITIDHAPLLYEKLQAQELYTFIPTNQPESVEKLAKKYQYWANRGSESGEEIWLNYAIHRKSDNEYLGTLQCTYEVRGRTYIAYEIFPSYWRNGIAKECVSALVDFIFSNFDLRSIFAHVDTRNLASQKLLESLGFCKICRINKADHFKGEDSDEFVYELSPPPL